MPAQPLTDEQKLDAERLRFLFKKWQAERKGQGLASSQAEAAELLGLGFGQSAFSQYLRGDIPLNVRVVARCAVLFGCMPEEISPAIAAELHALGGAAGNHIPAPSDKSKTSHIPGVIEDSLSAPKPRIDEPLESNVGEELELKAGRAVAVVGEVQGGPDGYISIDDYPVGQGHGWVQVYTADPSAYGLRVRGDSMRPRIKSGEHIVVEPGIEAQPGDDVVVKFVDGSAVVKELLWTRDDEICLGSINNGIPPITRPMNTVLSIHRVAAIVPRGSGMYRTEL